MTVARPWLNRIRNAHPDHRDIARGLAWVVLFVFAAKVAGAVKEMTVAWRYGVGRDVDAYLFLFNLVSWPIGVWFSILAVVLVPMAARLRRHGPEELAPFRAELLGLTVLIGAGLSILGYAALEVLLRSGLAGLPPATTAMALRIAPIMAPLLAVGMLVSLFSAWMLAAGRHANTLLEGVPAIGILVVLLVFPATNAAPLAWGTLVGYMLQALCLVLLLARTCDIEAPRFTQVSAPWIDFRRGFGIMLAGQALTSVITVLDQFFAAHLDTGAIATMSYAGRILALLLSLGATAVTRATLPVFSRAHTEGGDRLVRLALHWTRLLFVLGVAATVVGYWLGPRVVALLFQRGAFTAKNSVAVAEVFRYGLAQLPFYLAGLVLVSLLSSQRRYRAIALIAASNLVVKVAANAVLVPHFGINGLMLATAIMLAMSCVMLRLVIARSPDGRA